ncbi:MAG: permease [Ktedonobacteraceae bacterium]|nr:permease [Ktedonobacteraceae bacterium]
MFILQAIGQALLASVGMAWQVMWSLVLGFLISGMIQAYVSRAAMSRALGRAGFKEVALATGFGAASSSCSYAAIAAAKSIFKRGAHLIPALAFMFASTNLVIELGLILWQLMGWQFALAEWLGGIVLIAIMTLLVKLTYPKKIVEQGRVFQEQGDVNAMHHGNELAPGGNLWEKVRSSQGWVYVAHYVAMDWSMIWKDMIVGFLIAGFLGVLVPNTFWNALFIKGVPLPIQVVENAIVGPIIAVISFVCSIGNVPLAAVLFAGGITFGGAIAFIYADLIVLPILDIYRKYYGWRLAAYITGVLFATMVLTAIIVDAVFSGLDRLLPTVHFIPTANSHFLQQATTFSFDYTAVLNILSVVVIAVLIYLNVKHPMMHMGHGAHSGHDIASMGEEEQVQAAGQTMSHDGPERGNV